ncbi:DUF58 domain-containing protein [Pseudobutyrivibrio xylanivorans]|uniref:DUF58 domain-containing protein n=1 Tax=Pseudobutyrivibrio xylanivorans TaxID=185007 RepID=A0A5P6VPT0_PSEXY|nr:DUF58 domain-containing protein [Pseudobutyrivibrio xylanivorans]QFJ54402.1 DUF58 domain-containing protein [Pseudobutyrivibrio xylanivorans]
MKLFLHKRWIIAYLFILVLCLIFASFYGGPVPFVVLYALLLILPLSILYTLLNYHFLRIYQEIEVHKLTRGEIHHYRVLLENSGFLPIYKMGIFLLNDRCTLYDISDGIEVSLTSFQKQELTSDITCKYAGAYNIGIEKISLSDPFGMYTVHLDIPYSFRAIVNPPITDAANSVLEIENLVNNSGLKSDHLLEDIPGSDVRPYQTGDSLHSINWKVSARLSELVVRLPERMEKRTVTILLQAAQNPDDKYDITFLKKRDFFLEFIISAAWHFGKQSVPVRLIYPSGQIKESIVNDYNSFMEFYSMIADGIFYSTDNIFDQLQKYATTRRDSVYENDTWIIIKEDPQPGEAFYYICD